MQYIDQIGHSFFMATPPKRIVSLVPSQTEFLVDIGSANEIVGITKFCIHPDSFSKNMTKVGGTKNASLAKIHALKPDFIIANKEENTAEMITQLQAHYPVYTSDISTLEEAKKMMSDIGIITDRIENVKILLQKIEQAFQSVRSQTKQWRSIYLIWRKPWMTVGADTFIHHLMQMAGFENLFAHSSRYPVLSELDFKEANPELILLSSEPYPFKERHVAELALLCPDAKILLVDGEMFSWYGSRLIQAAAYLAQLQQALQQT